MSKSILLLKDQLDGAKVSAVQAACSQLGASVDEATSTDECANSSDYDLCIAGLKRGERQVPEAICQLLSRQGEKDEQANVAPLLMLCDEPLVRSHIVLQDARVNLLSSPLSDEVLCESIRSLMEGVALTVGDQPASGGDLPMTESWGHHYWSCRIAQDIEDPDLISDKRSDGVLTCVCKPGTHGEGGGSLDPLETLFLDRESGVNDAMRSIHDVGTVASFNTQTARWNIEVVGSYCRVFLTSPQRHPYTFEITDNRHLWAAPGDLLMIVRDGDGVCIDEIFDLARRAGGRVVARKIRECQDQVGENFACMFMEVVG